LNARSDHPGSGAPGGNDTSDAEPAPTWSASGAGEDLTWLINALWGQASPPASVHITTDGTVPAGYRVVERFAVVPNLARARFLVPLASRRAAWASLCRYNAMRPLRTRLARATIGAGMRIGVAQRLLSDRLVVCIAEAADPSRALLSGHLREILDEPDLTMAVGIHPWSPGRKPTLQLFGRDGRPLGYVKVGWSPLTRALVRNEARALASASSLRAVSSPHLRWNGPWNGLDIVVSRPLPAGVRRHGPPEKVPPLETIREIAERGGIRRLPLGASRYWAEVQTTVDSAEREGTGGLGAVPARYARRLERSLGEAPLQLGAWHGDWVPWNLAWRDGELFAWDWEYSGEEAPLGFDLFHYQFQVAFVLEGRSAAEAAKQCLDRGVPLLRRLGVPLGQAEDVGRLYLLEMLLRDYRMKRLAGSWTTRLYPDLLGVLAARC
jgi:hypothetical protein